jgi:ectoine hydroxylase-related dioxygenase (phytanoyl-CoA dioxygenase family)
MPAGSVMVMNAYCWHGGGENRTGALRRALHSFFMHVEQRRDHDQMYLSPETYARLDEPTKAVLDADSLSSAPSWKVRNLRERQARTAAKELVASQQRST